MGGCAHTSNINISKTSGRVLQNISKASLNHLDGGKAASGFGPDRIRTLVSMTTYSSNMVIMGKTVSPRFLDCF